MIVLAAAGGVVLLVLGAVATTMAIVGLIAAAGGLRLKRCRGCGHMVPTAASVVADCPYCRHPRLHHLAPGRLHHLFPGES